MAESPLPAGPRRYFAPWHLAYLLLGLIHSGMLPFLLPLVIASSSRDLSSVAYVVGAYYVGMLPAPLLGLLAERLHLFRPVFFGGFVALSAGLAAMPETGRFEARLLLALLSGMGAGAVATVAPLFVIDFTPKAEWEPRIGWLQSANGFGQLAGLLIAGLVARGPLAYGFWLACAFALLALVVGRIGLPSDGRSGRLGPPRLAWADLMAAFHAGAPFGRLLQHSHHLQHAAVRALPVRLGAPFSRFLLAWAAFSAGIAPFFAYYPLIMDASYGIDTATTALVYALAAGVGVALFVLVGRLADRYGARIVFQAGLALRMAGFVVLGALTLADPLGEPAIALCGFVLIVLAWPVLSVSGTGLAARLTPVGEGAAMGLLSATTAAATVLGTFLGGPLVEAFGYRVVPLLAVAGLAGAEALMGRWVPGREDDPEAERPPG